MRVLAPVLPSKIVAVGLDYRDHAAEQGNLVAFISAVMTLLPGDIISTGTPAGIGPLAAGDVVTVRVSGVGDLVNPVIAGIGEQERRRER